LNTRYALITLRVVHAPLIFFFLFKERYHYMDTSYTQMPLSERQEADKRKRELAAEKGITLISIPFWWDGTRER